MPSAPVIIYNRDLDIVAELKNAYRITYDKRLNQVWSAKFYLPIDSPHYDEVTGRRYAEIYDGDDRIGLFRIEKPRDDHDESEFRCRHVLTTLLDDQLVGVHSGIVGTNDAIDYVLGEQSDWTKGTVDFSRNFHHRWEDITLLEALLSIPDRYNEDYQWTFDTTSYPWTLNLKSAPTETSGLIYYEENAEEIERRLDFSELYNKLYAYGNGSGADQLTLADSSSTSNEYVEDTTSQNDYGTITRVWEDQRYTVADNLYDAAVARLDRHKDPRIEYRASAIDLYRKFDVNQFELGKKVVVRDQQRGIDVTARVERVGKEDVTGSPGQIKVEIANQSKPFPDFGRVAYADDLDQVKEGGQYAKVYSTQIEAGEILLSAIKGGGLPELPSTPDTAGLYLGAEYLGYHDGTNWITYMDNSGHLRLERYDTGAKVELLPDADQGLQVIDNASNPVLQALTGGTDVGDVIMGDEAGDAYAKYDKSAGSFIVRGSLTADDINGGTLDFAQISRSGLEVITSEIADGAVEGQKISSSTTITAGSGDNVAVLDGADDTWRMYAGDSTPSSAPFRVSQNGLVVANDFYQLKDGTGRDMVENGIFKSVPRAGDIQTKSTSSGSLFGGSWVELLSLSDSETILGGLVFISISLTDYEDIDEIKIKISDDSGSTELNHPVHVSDPDETGYATAWAGDSNGWGAGVIMPLPVAQVSGTATIEAYNPSGFNLDYFTMIWYT